jgi:hypothetical protein
MEVNELLGRFEKIEKIVPALFREYIGRRVG